ncbi:MAG: tRNA preQ1(34) S-adenosylmethionine ribosyltransferase-isomerase QueA [Candidatus Doudnabacteria bacterium]|nr:tRNA preQ1(34) S-adenosylmethionine ribosyltransferase-isomerase QueA [Candidatus Doudnabacteria bacterium]
MKINLHSILKAYDYRLPEELIAQKPARPRDSARLLVYNKKLKTAKFDTFKHLGKYLPKNAVLVFNQTKVVPARLKLKKETGGVVEILYIKNDNGIIHALCNKHLAPDSKLQVAGAKQLHFTVLKKVNQFYYLKPSFPSAQIKSILEKYGQTPLPPYIKHSPLSEKQKREQYQTVFAKNGLSVAAPTASLHFSKSLIASLKKQGIEVEYLTLNVNLGTFAPLREENLKTGKLHSETFEIEKPTADRLNLAKKQGRPIIAVGTTVIRTLESAAHNNKLTKLSGDTRLFIQPGYKFKFISGTVTNFHVPKSSLLMLISALVGKSVLLNLYKKAISKKFRFFSFGDGMIILP